jgi:hypothetical protein
MYAATLLRQQQHSTCSNKSRMIVTYNAPTRRWCNSVTSSKITPRISLITCVVAMIAPLYSVSCTFCAMHQIYVWQSTTEYDQQRCAHHTICDSNTMYYEFSCCYSLGPSQQSPDNKKPYRCLLQRRASPLDKIAATATQSTARLPPDQTDPLHLWILQSCISNVVKLRKAMHPHKSPRATALDISNAKR